MIGVVVSVGGQTPNNLAMGLSKHGVYKCITLHIDLSLSLSLHIYIYI